MLFKIRNTALSSSILLVMAMYPSDILAQSIDNCMNANQNEAISLCKSILDNGSRNADVYWKLASALYQDGQQTSAGKTLDDALRLHPGNSKLLKLKDIISSATTEQEMLEIAAQMNQRSLDQDALKIACLTKFGLEGITACKRRLELTDDDGNNMRARLAELQTPAKIATSPTDQSPLTDQAPTTEQLRYNLDNNPELVIDTDNNQTTTETDPIAANEATLQVTEEREIAHKQLVTQVQSMLNELGFPTGNPDGFPGSKTRDALSDFYTVLDEPASKSITELTLEDLYLQKTKLANAQQLVKQSEDALAQNNTILAKAKLADAKASSQLLKVPEELERKLRESQPKDLAKTFDETSVQSEPNFGEPQILDTQEITTATNTELENAPDETFDDLMNKINTLHGKIRRVEEDQVRRLDQVRDLM